MFELKFQKWGILNYDYMYVFVSECVKVCLHICAYWGRGIFFFLAGKSELAKTPEGFAMGFTDNSFSLFKKETLQTRWLKWNLT